MEKKYSSALQKTFWRESTAVIRSNKLDRDISADVVIVGGGIAGLSVARNLSLAGKKIVLIEDGLIGSGETGNTTAHLVNALDDRYFHLEKLYGEEFTRLAADSHTKAINFVEQIVESGKINCDFRRVNGYLFRHPSDEEDVLEKEFEAASRAGLGVKLLKHVPHVKKEKLGSLEFLNQAQFHPMKYLNGLVKTIVETDGRIFTETHADEIDANGIVTSDHFHVKADFIVVATNAPVNSRVLIPLKQFAFRTYVIGAIVRKDSLPFALWWDTGDHESDSEIPPYHYVRLHPYNNEYDLLISGGEDHATGLADAQDIPEQNRYASLEGWTRRRFPIEEVVYKWSGQVMEPMDSLAYIGRTPKGPENIFIATGDSGNGITHGTIAGMLIPDLILGRENKYEELYNPSRVKLKAAKTFLKEFGGGFFAYLKHKPHDAAHVELEDIRKGDGKIMKVDGEKFGVHRDDENQLHAVSATCTHLGCIIKWNRDQRSWDCPCHGSRFTHEGKVINGPANKNLAYYKEEEIAEEAEHR